MDRRELRDLEKAIAWKFLEELGRNETADVEKTRVWLVLGRREPARDGGARPLALAVDFGKFDPGSFQEAVEAGEEKSKRTGTLVVPLESPARSSRKESEDERGWFYARAPEEKDSELAVEISELNEESRDELLAEVARSGFSVWLGRTPLASNYLDVECPEKLLLEWAAAGGG